MDGIMLEFIDGFEPKISHHGDAGVDCYSRTKVDIKPFSIERVPLGIKIKSGSSDYYIQCIATSKNVLANKFMVHPGVIDVGYRKEIFAIVENRGTNPITIEPGDKVCQLIMAHNLSSKFFLDSAEIKPKRLRKNNE